jgi:hypothetical protein
MALKYDLTPHFANNPFLDIFVYTIIYTHTLLAYVYVIAPMFIAFYVFNRVQDDTGLSLLQSGLIGFIIAVLLFYMGVQLGVTLMHGKTLALFVGVLSLGAGFMYYTRSND